MKRSRIEIIITGLLIFLLFFLVVRGINRVKKKKESKPIPITKPIEPQPDFIQTAGQPKFEIISKYAQKLAWVRDPFIKSPVKKEVGIGLVLEGIIWDEANPQALINDQIVKIGDKMDGYEVLEIRKDIVILTDGVKQYKLELWEKKGGNI